jgi:gliding motility-associated-like protein
MNKHLPKFAILLLLMLLSYNTKATHIVGGELFYRCLGNDVYEITLTIYRDCYNGNPNAFFDADADIGIYSGGVLVDSLKIPFDPMINDTLDEVLTDTCLAIVEPVCVHTTTYVGTVTLPTIPGGYDLIYQRCCRNVTIVNIVDPLDSGATFGVSISQRALEECNSSAVFNDWPPIYICTGEPLIFDQSATDLDGDSIVYRLCTPLLGATPNSPMPESWNQTVPADVTWVTPPYSVLNMMNSNPLDPNRLKIDPVTGLLTCIPDVVGQFVVGICVEEYRDGELISTTRRDFQFNTGICAQAVSAIFVPEVICNNALEVIVNNQSQNAVAYEWYFNDPAFPGAVITDVSPSYVYSDTGAYTIMLIAQPGQECVDTSYANIQLNYYSLNLGFDYEFVNCDDTMTIAGLDFSSDSISTITDWDWTITDAFGNLIDVSSEQNPIFQVGISGTVTMQVVITAANGCMDSLAQTFEVNVLTEPFLPDTIISCELDSVLLNPNSGGGNVYFWTPPTYLSDVNIPSPWAYPEQTTTYSLIITDSVGFCETLREITIVVPPSIDLILPNDTTICSPDFELIALSDLGETYNWAYDAGFTAIFDTLANTTVTPLGEVTYYLEVFDQFNCSIIDSVTISGNGINVTPDAQPVVCDGENATVSINNLDPVDILTYSWSPVGLILSGINTNTALVATTGPGIWPYYVSMENQFGCTLVDSVLVGVLDTTSQAAFVSDQQCSGYSVQFTNTSVNAPFMIWTFGDPNNPNATSTAENPEYNYPGPGTYTVTLAINAAVNCPDTFSIDILVAEPNINVAFDYDYNACTDTTTVYFSDLSTNTQSTITGWQWVFSNGDTLLTQNADIQLTGSQVLGVELTILSDDGCNDSIALNIPISLIDINLVDTLTSCPGVPVPLNPGGSTTYVYQWSPATGLDDPTSPNPLASPEVTTTYTVTVTQPAVDTCELVRDITVEVPPQIQMVASNDTSICNTTVNLFVSSPQAVSYTWSNVPTFNSVISTASTINAVPGEPTIYYVRATDINGCHKVDTITVFGNAINVMVPDYNICISDTLAITPMNNDNGDVLSFDWSPASEIVAEPGQGVALVVPTQSQVYTAVVENQFGCLDTIESQVMIYDYTLPIFASANPDTILSGDTTQLIVTDSMGYIYTWTPNNTLTDPTIFNPLAFPTETTDYTVFVENQDGCSNAVTVRVVVTNIFCEDPYVFFPNAFTPNGDGENDFLKVFGNYIEEVHWVIYNRWGQKMFEANSVFDEWDGRFDGKELGADVFGYYLEVRCVGGAEYFRKGNVTLLR